MLNEIDKRLMRDTFSFWMNASISGEPVLLADIEGICKSQVAKRCKDCPVKQATGLPYCIGTPAETVMLISRSAMQSGEDKSSHIKLHAESHVSYMKTMNFLG